MIRAPMYIWNKGSERFLSEVRWSSENRKVRENMGGPNIWKKSKKIEIIIIKSKRSRWSQKHASIPCQRKIVFKNYGIKFKYLVKNQVAKLYLLYYFNCPNGPPSPPQHTIQKGNRMLTLIAPGV